MKTPKGFAMEGIDGESSMGDRKISCVRSKKGGVLAWIF